MFKRSVGAVGAESFAGASFQTNDEGDDVRKAALKERPSFQRVNKGRSVINRCFTVDISGFQNSGVSKNLSHQKDIFNQKKEATKQFSYYRYYNILHRDTSLIGWLLGV